MTKKFAFFLRYKIPEINPKNPVIKNESTNAIKNPTNPGAFCINLLFNNKAVINPPK